MKKPKAPDLSPYQSLGEALRAALKRHEKQLALIEADRDRENCRLTYGEFRQSAARVASTFQQFGFQEADRVAILMSNQSKWLIAAYAVFFMGGVLVPIDYKLTATEQLALLGHARVKALIVEYPLWKSLTQAERFADFAVPLVIVTEAPANAILNGVLRWEHCLDKGEPTFVQRRRSDTACIVYSSGTGGRPKGCMLTHDNYLEQCRSLMAWYPFWPGLHYLSILPTNHAIDFMVGFIGPFVCGATVVHLRTLRPEYLKEAFARFRITYVSVVPMVLKALEAGLRKRFDELPLFKGWLLHRMIMLNRLLTGRRPWIEMSRRLLPQIHKAFGNELLAVITGGAFVEPSTLQFFYDLGIPVANGYGLTEAGTAVTVNDLNPFRSDTVGKPLPGVEIKVMDPDLEGVGQVAVRGRTVMAGYLDDPELTRETIVNGWLMTGDLGRIDPKGHLQLVGRLKNMIVTEGGKNIYPEDVESNFDGLAVKEYCVFAVNYVWRQHTLLHEQLMIVLHPDPALGFTPAVVHDLRRRNRSLADYKRVSGFIVWDDDFPRTASLKIKRGVLADQIAGRLARDQAIQGL